MSRLFNSDNHYKMSARYMNHNLKSFNSSLPGMSKWMVINLTNRGDNPGINVQTGAMYNKDSLTIKQFNLRS